MTDRLVNYDCRQKGACYRPMDDETMGQRILRQMDAKGLSQSSVAKLLKTQRQTVHAWVHDISQPTPANLVMLAELLGTDVHYLVFGPPRQPEGGFPRASDEPRRSTIVPIRRRRT